MEEDGALTTEAEKITQCKDATFLMTECGEGVWCESKGIICYKALGESCEDENPVTTLT